MSRGAEPIERGRAASRALRRGTWTGLDQASVMGVELVAAILTWAGIGWLLDRWLGTAPWLLAIGALVGNGAGLYLVWLRGGRLAAREASEATQAREAAGGTGAGPALGDAEPRSGGRDAGA